MASTEKSMKLTLDQRWALAEVSERAVHQRSVSNYGRTYRSLYRRGLIEEFIYANGPHWSITDAGRLALAQSEGE